MAKPAGAPSLRKHDQDLENWDKTPDPPCDVFKCANFVRCGTCGLACEAFAEYVHRARCRAPTEPSADIFDRLGIPLPPELARVNRPRVRLPAND